MNKPRMVLGGVLKNEKISGAAGEEVGDGETGAGGQVAAASGFQVRGPSSVTGHFMGVDRGSAGSHDLGVTDFTGDSHPAIEGVPAHKAVWREIRDGLPGQEKCDVCGYVRWPGETATCSQAIGGTTCGYLEGDKIHHDRSIPAFHGFRAQEEKKTGPLGVVATFQDGEIAEFEIPSFGPGAVEDPEPASEPVAPPCVVCSAESDGECENCGAPICVNHDSGEFEDELVCADKEGCSKRCEENQRLVNSGTFQPASSEPVPMGAMLILRERRRQVFEEGWDAAHDDEHENGELAAAAVSYVLQMYKTAPWAIGLEVDGEDCWPFEWAWFKPKTAVRDLVRAGAFLAAEIDRIQRVEAAAIAKLNKDGNK